MDPVNEVQQSQLTEKAPTISSPEVVASRVSPTHSAAQLRQLMHLSDISPLTSPVLLAQEGEKMDELCAQNLQDTLKQGRGFIDRNVETPEHAANRVANKKASGVNSVAKKIAVALISRKDFSKQNAQALVTLLESSTVVHTTDYVSLAKEEVIAQFRGLTEAGWSQIPTGVDRMRRFCGALQKKDFINPETFGMMKQLAQMEQPAFDALCAQLNSYCFLDSDFYLTDQNGKSYPSTSELAKIIANGGLTADQKKLLDTQLQLCLLRGDISSPYMAEGTKKSLPHDLDLILHSSAPVKNLDMAVAIERMVLRKNSESPYLTYTFLDCVKVYSERGYLSSIVDLANKGIDCSPLFSIDLKSEDRISASAASITSFLELASNADDLAFVTFVAELSGEKCLTISNCEKYKKLASNKEVLGNMCSLFSKLPPAASTDLRDFFTRVSSEIVVNSSFADIMNMELYRLFADSKKLSDSLPPGVDKEYWKMFESLYTNRDISTHNKNTRDPNA